MGIRVLKNGKPAIRYDYRYDKLYVKEENIKESFSEYGKIQNKSFSIYLPERDDNLAMSIYIEHTEKHIADLQAELDKATERLEKMKKMKEEL